jgi:hypothetical protein
VVSAASGGISIPGQGASLEIGRLVTAASGNLPITGQAASLRAARRLEAGAGGLSITGSAADLTIMLVAPPPPPAPLGLRRSSQIHVGGRRAAPPKTGKRA